jgi:glutamine amidotransferase
MVTIIDYGMGNLGSVKKAFELLKCKIEISNNPEKIRCANKIVLPGVGQFRAGMNNLRNMNLIDAINDAVNIKKKPILGICLGMQLLAKHSEEGDSSGLGWIDAEVVRFVNIANKLKIPHMGWNSIQQVKECPILDFNNNNYEFYFVHSYHFKANDPNDIIAHTNYYYDFVSVVQKGNIFGVQFHPEKSHDGGRNLLQKFINY